jgi:hypothetical protein
METANGNEELIWFGPFLKMAKARRSGYFCKRCNESVLSARFGTQALQEIILDFGFWLERAFWTRAGVIEDNDSFLGLGCGCGTSFLRDAEPLWRIILEAKVVDGRKVAVLDWEIQLFN